MLHFALVGHPVAHSLSPPMHRAALVALDLGGRYTLLDVQPDHIAQPLADLRGGAFSGLNITTPHKIAAAIHCDRLTSDAARLGAVNTIVLDDDGVVVGHNTDLPAVRDCIEDLMGSMDGVTVAVIGAGGAARAAVTAAVDLGASEVRVHNRSAERAEQLADDLQGPIRLVPIAADAMSDVALIIHATPQGMGLASDDEAYDEVYAVAREMLTPAPREAKLLDLAYGPTDTPYCAAALDLHMENQGGLDMLARQAALSFELWTGKAVDWKPMRTAARRALG
jgi:shikimate dehydrogenase